MQSCPLPSCLWYTNLELLCQNNNNSHTEPLFKKPEILRLQDMIVHFKLLFMQDYIRGHLPLSFRNIWISNLQYGLNCNPNGPRLLRNDYDMYVPFIRLESYVYFPLPDFPRTWNKFDNQDMKNVVLRTLRKS